MTLLRLDGRVPADTRVPGGLITGEDLASVWPEVSTRLGKLLTSRGATRDLADDVVQEVAARALARGVVFEDAADLMRWAVPVALNLLVDSARAAGRVTVGIDGWDSAVSDVADVVAHRDRLHRVLGAVAHLSAADRAALTSDEAPIDRREAVKLAVRRHRARRRLIALVDGVAGILVWFGVWGRRTRATRGVAVATVPVALALPVALVLVTPAPVESPREVRISTASPRLADARVPAAPRPAVRRPAERPATVRTGAASVSAVRRPGTKPKPQPREVLRVGSQGNGVRVVERPATESDALLCLQQDLPLVGTPCVG